MLKRHQLFSLPFDSLTMEETLEWVKATIKARVPRQHTVINAAKVVNAQKDPFLRQSIIESDLVNVDGQAVVWAARLLNIPCPERVAGIDLMWKVMEVANEQKLRVYFLGATPEVLTQLIKRVQSHFPNLVIAGSNNGYFTSAQSAAIASQIKETNSDILFVGMPTPLKERFIHQFLNEMKVPFSMGVGGSFDVLAGKTPRAPVWMQKIGLEWFFRLSQEPRRLFKRYALTNGTFSYMVARELVFKRNRKST